MSYIETDTLKKLHQRLIDSRDGFGKAAETVDKIAYRQLFEMRHHQRTRFAATIGGELVKRDEEFSAAGSITAAAHRFWTDITAAIGDSDEAVAREVERAEKHLLDLYDEILSDAEATDPLYAELNRQRAEITKLTETLEDIAA